jgi:hypothetical protein
MRRGDRPRRDCERSTRRNRRHPDQPPQAIRFIAVSNKVSSRDIPAKTSWVTWTSPRHSHWPRRQRKQLLPSTGGGRECLRGDSGVGVAEEPACCTQLSGLHRFRGRRPAASCLNRHKQAGIWQARTAWSARNNRAAT